MKVNVLTIGDEILIGQTVDTNSAWMGQQLNLVGATIVNVLSVADDLEEIIEGLERLTQKGDVVLITGGLGPTKDDVTKKALAKFFDVELTFHQLTYDRILKLFERWGRKSTEAHRLQCYMPSNAKFLTNKMGTAPGMWFDYNGKVIVSMPGVPYEMKYLMENEVIPRIKKQFKGLPIIHQIIRTVGEGESRMAAKIEDIEDNLPKHLKIAYLPNLGAVKIRLTATGPDLELLQQSIDETTKAISDRLSAHIYGYGEIELEEAIGIMLKEAGLTISTAESCTGGYIAHKLTSISGSSAYFMGSIVAYANEIKSTHLKVAESTLKTHGAVSEATVTEMVKGALDLLGTDIAVSISGIAGPGGGSEEKPVGTVWMAVGNKEITKTRLIRAGKDRIKNIQYASVHALNLVREFLLEQYKLPQRISRNGTSTLQKMGKDSKTTT